jgi:hypothetical protein
MTNSWQVTYHPTGRWFETDQAVPASSQDVLICSNKRVTIGCYRDGTWWEQERYPHNQSTINAPEYWMPIPKLPT